MIRDMLELKDEDAVCNISRVEPAIWEGVTIKYMFGTWFHFCRIVFQMWKPLTVASSRPLVQPFPSRFQTH